MDAPGDHRGMRVFFALWATPSERAALAAWQPALRKLCGGRAMRRETLHCTLVFIGDIGHHDLERLQLAASEVEGEGFTLRLDKMGYWGHNHIVSAMPHHVPPQLMQLADDLGQRLDAHHFRFDRRAYQPHVTLLRNAHGSDAPLPVLPPVDWRVEDFALVQSDPSGGRTTYRVLARFPLRQGGG